MKIALVLHGLFLDGPSTLVENLAIQYSTLGHEVEIWTAIRATRRKQFDYGVVKAETQTIEMLRARGIEIRQTDKRPGKDRRYFREKLRTFADSFNPDVIHTHLESISINTALAFRNSKYKIVQTFHSERINHKILQRAISRRFCRYIAISQKMKKDLSYRLGISEEKILCIYNGVDVDSFKHEREPEESVKRVINVGNLWEAKDQMNLLRALLILKSKLEEIGMRVPILTIVGEGKLREKLFEFVERNSLEKHVEFLGYRSDISDLLKKSETFVQSSEWEGLPIVLCEALAAGLPIVATNAGGTREIIDNMVNGIIVPTKNPQALAEAMYNVITNSSLRVMLSKSAVKKANEFSIQQCAQKHMDLYRELMKDSKQS